MKVSAAQVAKLENIHRNLIPDFKEEFREEKINITTANELAGMEPEQQRETYEEYREKGEIKVKEVQEKKQRQKEEEKQKLLSSGKIIEFQIPGQQNLFGENTETEPVTPVEDTEEDELEKEVIAALVRANTYLESSLNSPEAEIINQLLGCIEKLLDRLDTLANLQEGIDCV